MHAAAHHQSHTGSRDAHTGRKRGVYLEPVWRLPRSYDNLTAFPPDGYQMLAQPTGAQRVVRRASRRALAFQLMFMADSLAPTSLLIALLQRRSTPPAGTDLTYAHHHLVFRREPWVVEMEYPSILLGAYLQHLSRYRRLLERTLASPWCRGIRCWSEATRQATLTTLDCAAFEEKIALIPHAVPARRFVKAHPERPPKLLFVGSANIPGEFAWRGGLETLAAYRQLANRYPGLELVMRTDIPAEVRRRYAGMPGLRLLERVVPWAELEQEFLTSDIFVLPTHSTPPFSLLDAMSFELPVVTLDVWANGELVRDGTTGLLVPPSRHIPYYLPGTRHPNFGARSWMNAVRTADPTVITGLAGALTRLLDDPALRQRLGRAGRWAVEHGAFSLAARNAALTTFFDRALAP